jgi:hypothetical protein
MRIRSNIKFLALVVILISVQALHSQAPSSFAQKIAGMPRDLVHRRQEWFYNQRAYPLGYIPAGARLKALHQLDQMVRTQKDLASLPSAAQAADVVASTAWTSIGPQPISPLPNDQFSGYPVDSGRVTALAVDPRDVTGNTVYLGAAEGGVWVTTNGGQFWTALTDSQPSLAVGSIALDPTTNPTTVYVGTGEENFNFDAYYGAGVLKSSNGGKTWTQDVTFSQSAVGSPTASGPYIGALAVDPANNQILLAGVGTSPGSTVTGGIWRSTNGGNTWAPVLPESAFGNGTGLVFDPNTPGRAYAALGAFSENPSNGVFKSTDGGATWAPLSTLGIGPGLLGRITLAIGPPASSGNPGELLAAIADNSTCSSNPLTCSRNLLGLFKSTDGGGTWTKLSAPNFCGDQMDPTKGQCFYDMAVGVSPANPALIYAGGTNDFGGDALTVSMDGGITWSPDLYAGGGIAPNPNGQLHTDTHAIAFSKDGTKLYVGNDGGIWLTTNVGAPSNVTWTDLNNSLNITQFYPGISIFPGNPNLGFGGTQDNGTLSYSGTLGWETIIGGDGGYTAINPSQTTLYAANAFAQGIFEFGSISSTPTLLSFTPACSQMAVSLLCDQPMGVPPLVADPENPQTLYFGTFRVWQTTDGSVNPADWFLLPAQPSLMPGDSITTIAVAPNDSRTIYVGTHFSGIQATNSLGSAWNPPGTGLPVRFVTQIAVDPRVPTKAYAAFSGFSSCGACDQLGHIFQTTTGGSSWANITGNLPDIPVNDLAVDPVINATLYAATDIGVFSTSDGGNTWSPLVSGLPRAAVLGLRLDQQSRVLWAATHGRGMWALQLPTITLPVLTSISPTSAFVGSPAFTLSANGSNFISGAVINFNGQPQPTTFVSSTSLTAAISASSVAAAGSFPVTVTNPAPDAGTSAAATFTVNIPLPVLNSISPTSAAVGSQAFTLSVSGSNFDSGAVVNFNGAPQPTTFVSSTSLTATISASSVAAAGSFSVTVTNPAPDAGTSAPSTFTVNNPLPVLNSISPTSVAVGSPAFTLSVSGSNFNASSVVNFNAKPVSTTFVSSTALTAAIPATDVATAASDSVTVSNPAPGGGTSTAASFSVSTSDFVLNVVGGGTETISAGQTAVYKNAVSSTGVDGFSFTVVLSCSTTAPMSTCSAAPSSLMQGNSATIRVFTTQHGSVPPFANGWRPSTRILRHVPIWLLLMLAMLFLTFASQKRHHRLALAIPLALVLLSIIFESACASNPTGGTSAGTYSVTVTGVSGTITHSVVLNLTVK